MGGSTRVAEEKARSCPGFLFYSVRIAAEKWLCGQRLCFLAVLHLVGFSTMEFTQK